LPYDPNRPVRIEFLSANEPARVKLKVIGGFKAREEFKLRLQARPGDILGRVAHQLDRKWMASKDGEFEVALGKLSLSRGRYNYAMMIGSKLWKGTVEIGQFDINQLKEQQKKNSYYVQTERKKLWVALEQLEAAQKSKKTKISPKQIQVWSKWPEVRQLRASQNTLAFPEAWQEFARLVSLISANQSRGVASKDIRPIVGQVRESRKKLRAETVQGISLEDF